MWPWILTCKRWKIITCDVFSCAKIMVQFNLIIFFDFTFFASRSHSLSLSNKLHKIWVYRTYALILFGKLIRTEESLLASNYTYHYYYDWPSASSKLCIMHVHVHIENWWYDNPFFDLSLHIQTICFIVSAVRYKDENKETTNKTVVKWYICAQIESITPPTKTT